MNAAVDAGGHVVGVVADSLLRTAHDSEVRHAVNDDQLCLCSPYKPTAGFSVANAMGRNKLIYAMSTATLVVECEEGSGGTWAGAVEALRGRTAPVIAWTGVGASSGNVALRHRGAPAGRGRGPLPAAKPRSRANSCSTPPRLLKCRTLSTQGTEVGKREPLRAE